MRIAIVGLCTVLGMALVAGAAHAQSCPAGTQGWVIRTSKIKPGQDAVFKKAMADQEAWYRGKGVTTNILKAGPVVDPQTGPDPTTVMTVHMNSPTGRPASDAAWDAFVAEFRASSDMQSETYACMGDIHR